MRIAFSPTLRIVAGLLLAALLSIVGYKVFRRWISQGPEALLMPLVITLKPAIRYHFKTGQRKWPKT
jgi:TRAP-type C4-dicarboxylate transport system permease small subunit